MDDTVTCEICSENFSSGKHDPLMLPCGHTFCRMCMTQLKKKKNQRFTCPSCRKDYDNIDVNNLPIVFKLLNLLTDNKKIKMPSKVFLELSINDKCLGKVIILPWYQLRRAQQFAALCIGTFGVSYLGSSFHSVRYPNCPREYLAGGWYLSPHDGVRTWRDLMTELEWDGNAVGEALEGIVLGIPDADGGLIGDGSGFGICTREERGGTFKCPFGEVVSGMDVVKAAVSHDPVTEVIISRCGVVLSNLIK